MNKFLKSYIKDLFIALTDLDSKQLEIISKKIFGLKIHNNTAFLIGNGGSSSTPSHSAGDWTKELGIKTICLSDNTPSLTAFANDTKYSNIYKGQLKTFLSNGDIVIGFSGSGNSENVLNAIKYSKAQGNYTIGITGNYKENNGGNLAKIVDISIVVNSTSMERIEDVHLIINHIIKEFIKEKYLINE